MSDETMMQEENAVNEAEETKAKKEFHTDYGELVLSSPIRARSRDISVLKYDFSKLTNQEYINALISDKTANDPFHISTKQAFNLFCAAAARETEDVDATDIRERMSVKDTIFAVQVASVFFAISTREASMRTEKG